MTYSHTCQAAIVQIAYRANNYASIVFIGVDGRWWR